MIPLQLSPGSSALSFPPVDGSLESRPMSLPVQLMPHFGGAFYFVTERTRYA